MSKKSFWFASSLTVFVTVMFIYYAVTKMPADLAHIMKPATSMMPATVSANSLNQLDDELLNQKDRLISMLIDSNGRYLKRLNEIGGQLEKIASATPATVPAVVSTEIASAAPTVPPTVPTDTVEKPAPAPVPTVINITAVAPTPVTVPTAPLDVKPVPTIATPDPRGLFRPLEEVVEISKGTKKQSFGKRMLNEAKKQVTPEGIVDNSVAFAREYGAVRLAQRPVLANQQRILSSQAAGFNSLLNGQYNLGTMITTGNDALGRQMSTGLGNMSAQNSETQARITALQMSLGRNLTDLEARLASQIGNLNAQQIEILRQTGAISDQAAKALDILRKMSDCNPVTPFGPNRDCKP